MFSAVLVANRGEIAVRIIRTLRRLGIRAIAVYSDADAAAPHVALADEALRIGPAPPARSYLDPERILDACHSSGAQALHPGYGFLSENAAFARACVREGITFVGPPAEAIEAMGDKILAKRTVEAAGVPVVSGVHRPGLGDRELAAAAAGVGYPLLVKAAAGGGGKGMRVVREPAALAAALAAARREACGAFGDDTLLLERYLERARHIEIQVLADRHGHVVHLGERECSLQRRHQKVVEECPSPALDGALRQRMGAAAVAVARACAYTGAGTVEFIVPVLGSGDCPQGGDFFFLEMNTRLQVEHPVTELVYGVDLVEWQLRVAAGEPLSLDARPGGHAVEARVYAEDPERGFLPTGGTVLACSLRQGEGVRVDSGVAAGTDVGSFYDPLLAKVIAHGPDRRTAIARLDAALAGSAVLGVGTNIAFLRRLLADEDVLAGRLDTGLIERRLNAPGRPPADVPKGVPADVLVAAALARALELEPGAGADPFSLPGGWRVGEPAWTRLRLRAGDADAVDVCLRGRAAAAQVRIGEGEPRPCSARWDGADLLVTVEARTRRYACAQAGETVWIGRDGAAWALRQEDALVAARRRGEGEAAGPLRAPMPGTVTVVHAQVGDAVTAGQTLLVVEAMKMEHPVAAPADGIVTAVYVGAGQRVAMDEALAEVEPEPGGRPPIPEGS